MPRRCAWVPNNEDYIRYHDHEWGVPVHDDTKLFEMLILEGAQAGLSWATILAKRENYRRAFAGFDPRRVARFTARDVERLLRDPGIVRNRRKIAAAITNARAFLTIQDAFGSFDTYLWRFVNGRPRTHHYASSAAVPAWTPLSARISADLRRRGFRFVGKIIIYSFLQAVGVVNDHETGCFRHDEITREYHDRA